ncbi:hypothetical protein VTL71DRAFT_6700 [Oculimacula yallundae]|uniref:Uncharacterized protein n=1 Tax=Oculimacula yallundae TaxID=86028 RepID=A0ABR4BZE2_9HELO
MLEANEASSLLFPFPFSLNLPQPSTLNLKNRKPLYKKKKRRKVQNSRGCVVLFERLKNPHRPEDTKTNEEKGRTQRNDNKKK